VSRARWAYQDSTDFLEKKARKETTEPLVFQEEMVIRERLGPKVTLVTTQLPQG